MSSGQSDYIQKGIQNAEQATAEDKAHNYEAAVQHYMTAAHWLMQAIKYGGMNAQLKQTIRPKIASYIKRAEEIDLILKKKQVADGCNDHGNARNNKNNSDSSDSDYKQLKQKFEGAIVADPKVTFNDVIGLEQAKEALKEAVIWPVKLKKFFRGKRKPWTGILLYGPPGTGKSYLAKAIATECKSTFISVTSSDLLSKWLGESEKGVKCLFELARERQPCIVFIDEIDALCSQRNDTESESSRRVKTEFLVQTEGVGADNSGVLLLAATNIPWALDIAMRRRFEKRIYIPLPDVKERAAMFKYHLGTDIPYEIQDHEWMELGQKANYYSGADIAVVCREALLRPLRRLCLSTHFKRVKNPNSDGPSELWLLCSPDDPDAKEISFDELDCDDLFEPPVIMSDMLAALARQKPTVGENDLIEYEKFTEVSGQEGY
ncbi:unnamed protein product [Rotaria sp. Silwood1]|nr:unnamed protein product [Rotaria sp. Silwood1]